MVNVGGVMLDPVELRDALQWLGWQVRPVRKRRWGQWVTTAVALVGPHAEWQQREVDGLDASQVWQVVARMIAQVPGLEAAVRKQLRPDDASK